MKRGGVGFREGWRGKSFAWACYLWLVMRIGCQNRAGVSAGHSHLEITASLERRLASIEMIGQHLDMFTERVICRIRSVDGLARLVESATSGEESKRLLSEILHLPDLVNARKEQLSDKLVALHPVA